MRDWKNASKKDVDAMTIDEAKEIIQRHIDTGLDALANPTSRMFAPRYHMTKALMLILDEANKYEEMVVHEV